MKSTIFTGNGRFNDQAAHRRPLRLSRGNTLLEIFLALSLGGFISYGVLNVYITNKQSYAVQQANTVLNENARFALEFIGRELRTSGLLGCSSLQRVNSGAGTSPTATSTFFDTTIGYLATDTTEFDIANAALGNPVADSEDLFALSNAVYAFEMDATIAANFATANSTPVVGSDAIAVLRADEIAMPLSDDYNISDADPSNDDIEVDYIDGRPTVDVGELVVISDCTPRARIFRVISRPNTGTTNEVIGHVGAANNIISFNYTVDTGTRVAGLNATLFYVARDNVSGRFQLRQRNLFLANNAAGANVPIVDDVENMQIFFGLDRDPDLADFGDAVEYYVEVPTLANFANPANAGRANLANPLLRQDIISVRIHLAMRSVEASTTSNPRYVFAGLGIDPGDNRLRRTYTKTIALRQRAAIR